MDFIMGLPLTARKFNLIWVIVDRLTKSAHFILVNTNYNVQKYAEIYVTRVLCLHGVPKMNISDRGSQFVAHFWEQLHASLGTHLIHSLAYHPQTDGQTSWDKNLSWAEFSYNNSYQESLKMAPFETLYGRQCRTPLNWIEPGEKAIFGPDIVVEAEATVRRIQENLKVTKLRQESYTNKRRRPLQFEAGDHVYLKVSPMKGVMRFGVTGKLSPRYIGPFPILEKCERWHTS
jgi:hypothetical protein